MRAAYFGRIYEKGLEKPADILLYLTVNGFYNTKITYLVIRAGMLFKITRDGTALFGFAACSS